jgi:hypothetical protein
MTLLEAVVLISFQFGYRLTFGLKQSGGVSLTASLDKNKKWDARLVGIENFLVVRGSGETLIEASVDFPGLLFAPRCRYQ